MGEYDLKPTEENIKNTIYENVLDRNKDLSSFINMLYAINSGTVVCLDGDWGTGKTFFVKQVKYIIDLQSKKNAHEGEKNLISKITSKDESNKTELMTAYYDAWENDDAENPVLSIVYNIIKESEKKIKSANTDWKNILKTIAESVVPILEIIVDQPVVKTACKILESLKGKDGEIKKAINGDNIFSEIVNQDFLKSKINEFLLEVLGANSSDCLIIFIYELDRCKPSYAIELLESIKHYFDNDKISFVFTINKKQLVHTVKKYYGNDFNAEGYLDRFFDLSFSLPMANMDDYCRNMGLTEKTTYDMVCKKAINYFGFNLRQASHFYEIARKSAYKRVHSSIKDDVYEYDKTIQICTVYVVPIIIALRISNMHAYEKFISGKGEDIFYDFYKENDYLSILRAGVLNNNEIYKETVEIIENYSPKDKNKITSREKLKEIYDALFIFDYDKDTMSKYIGKYTFNKFVREKILEIGRSLTSESEF